MHFSRGNIPSNAATIDSYLKTLNVTDNLCLELHSTINNEQDI